MRRAQIQMMETVGILLVFFILLILGFVFYTNIMKDVFNKESAKSEQLQSIEVAQRISFLPELQCSEDNIITEDCIDILKLGAAKDIIQDNLLYYYDEFLYSDITVTEVYPQNRSWSLYNRPLENATKLQTDVPVSLFDAVSKEYHFGVLTVNVYSK